MIKRNVIRFEGKHAVPSKVLIGMQGDNMAEQVVLHLPTVQEGQQVYIKWAGIQKNADVVSCTAGENAGEWIWKISETDTRERWRRLDGTKQRTGA